MKTSGDFFIFCSGADPVVLEQCPTDRHKYQGIGATIFFTGVLAFFSSGYALYTVFESWAVAAAFGLIWGLMIFNLDRYIVMSMKSRGAWLRDAAVALPRIALAILLAVVISKPLELKIFEKEINAEIVQMEQEIYKKQEDGVKTRYENQLGERRQHLDALRAEISQSAAARDSLAKMAIAEADGTGGSMQRNLGPIYKAKKLRADQAQAELDAITARNLPLINEKENEIAQIEGALKNDVASLDRSSRYNGLAARMDALARLSSERLAILYASIFITLLFIAVETAPILVKLISTRSPYDYLLHQREHKFEMEHLEETTLHNNQVKNKLRFDTETGVYRTQTQIDMEKAVIDQKKAETLEALRNRSYDWEKSSAV